MTQPFWPWFAANMHRYGFYQPTPEKAYLSGYMYEPWHIDYIGVGNATYLSEAGLSIEEWLGLGPQTYR